MKKLALFIFSISMLTGCNAQTDKNTKTSENKTKPKVDYKVNKVYDENGNLVKYDSIYTYYYSNVDKNAVMNDSIFKQLNKHIRMNNPFMNEDFIREFFGGDDFSNDEFFSEDFFSKHFKKRKEMMQEMLSKMDSLKNSFLLKQYPLKKENKK